MDDLTPETLADWDADAKHPHHCDCDCDRIRTLIRALRAEKAAREEAEAHVARRVDELVALEAVRAEEKARADKAEQERDRAEQDFLDVRDERDNEMRERGELARALDAAEDRISELESALADMTNQRDAATALAEHGEGDFYVDASMALVRVAELNQKYADLRAALVGCLDRMVCPWDKHIIERLLTPTDLTEKGEVAACNGSFICEATDHEDGCFAPYVTEKGETCSTCGGTGRVDWSPGQQRHTEDDQQACPDCDSTEKGEGDD